MFASRRKPLLRLGCLLLLALAAAPAAAETKDERAGRFDAALEAERQRQALVGLAVAVIEDDAVAHVGSYGYADRERRLPVTAATRFRWASVSKCLTAVAAMQLVERKQLSLATPISKVRDDLPPDPFEAVTVEALLCHRGRVGHYRQMGAWPVRLALAYGDRDRIPWNAAKAVAVVAPQGLLPPATRYHYTTFGYILLGAVVESAGGEPFDEQVLERIAKPLGMTSLEPDYEFRDRPERTKGYRKRKQEIVASEPGDVSWKLPGGGYHSTVGDMARFGVGLLRGELLAPETQREMWRPRLDEGTKRSSGYALGFGVRMKGQAVVQVSHSGAQSRTRTLFVLEPLKKRGIAIMTNSEWANVNAIHKAAAKALGW